MPGQAQKEFEAYQQGSFDSGADNIYEIHNLNARNGLVNFELFGF